MKVGVYNETQYKYIEHMPIPKTLDLAKSIIAPMPGAIVEVFVKPGQTISDGQDLLIVEAMKM